MVQFSPIDTAKPGSVWMTLLSWTFEPGPMKISSLSPRSTTPNQTEASTPRRTLPITCALGAIQ